VGISVKEAMQLGGLAKSKVIAGHDGLDNRVEHVSVIEVPEAHQWFRGHELFLTAFYTIQDNVEAQILLLEKLKEKNSAALGICYPGMYYQSICNRVIATADELHIPIIEIPHDVAYIDVISPIIEEIQKKQSKEIHQAIAIQSQVHDWLAKRLSLQEMTINIQHIILDSFLLFNDHLDLLAYQLQQPKLDHIQEIQHSIQEKRNLLYTKGKKSPCQWTTSKGHFYTRPIRTGDQVYGYMVIVKQKDSASYVTELTYEYLSTGLALYFSQKIVLEETEKKLQKDFMDEWLSGSGTHPEMVSTRAQKLGWNLEDKTGLAVLQASGSKISCDHLHSLVTSFLIERKNRSIAMQYGQRIILLLHGGKRKRALFEEEYRSLCEALVFFLQEKGVQGVNISMALCRKQLIAEARELYQEVTQIVQIQALISALPPVLFSDQVPCYGFLPVLSTYPQAEKIIQLLQPLEQYDAEYQTNLVETLEYSLFSPDPQAISKQLNVHRNTLNYRRQRIRELLPVDPFSSPYRFQYELAILLKQAFR
jgi:purine catabolism regulator